MYYLDTSTFMRTTRDPVVLRRGEYYLSVVFAGLPEQWKAIESAFLGGFERRFLTLKIRGKLPLYKQPRLSDKAAGLLVDLQAFIRCLNEYYFIFDPPDLTEFTDIVEREVWDELKQSVVQDYSYKLWVAEQLNRLPFRELVSSVSQSISESVNLPMILHDTIDDTCDTNMMVIPNKNPLRFSNDSIIESMILNTTIIKPLISSVTGLKTVEEPEMAELIRRIEVKVSKGIILMPFMEFVTEILGTRNADWYRPRIKALEDAGKIKLIQISRKRIVVLDTTSEICYNCRHWDECSKDHREAIKAGEWDIYQAKQCDRFELEQA
jgi:hypothetical protein